MMIMPLDAGYLMVGIHGLPRPFKGIPIPEEDSKSWDSPLWAGCYCVTSFERLCYISDKVSISAKKEVGETMIRSDTSLLGATVTIPYRDDSNGQIIYPWVLCPICAVRTLNYSHHFDTRRTYEMLVKCGQCNQAWVSVYLDTNGQYFHHVSNYLYDDMIMSTPQTIISDGSFDFLGAA